MRSSIRAARRRCEWKWGTLCISLWSYIRGRTKWCSFKRKANDQDVKKNIDSVQPLITLDPRPSGQNMTKNISLIVWPMKCFTRRGDYAVGIDKDIFHLHKQFIWSENYRIWLLSRAWTPSSPIFVTRFEPLRLLALWNVKAQDGAPIVFSST
jgi:hypothetical protein